MSQMASDLRSSLQKVNGDWAGEPGRGMRQGNGRSDDHRADAHASGAGTFPSAIEFVKAAALRIRDGENRLLEQAERIEVLEAQRAEDQSRIAELEAVARRHEREHLETLELIEQSWIECSILRVALREAAREAQTAERGIRSTIREIDELKARIGKD